jgi:hypothetical protein
LNTFQPNPFLFQLVTRSILTLLAEAYEEKKKEPSFIVRPYVEKAIEESARQNLGMVKEGEVVWAVVILAVLSLAAGILVYYPAILASSAAKEAVSFNL